MLDTLKIKYLNACYQGDTNTVHYLIKNETKQLKTKSLMIKYLDNTRKGGHEEIFNTLVDYIYRYKSSMISGSFYTKPNLSNVLTIACKGGYHEAIEKIYKILKNTRDYETYSNQIWDSSMVAACKGGKLDIFKLYEKHVKYDEDFIVHAFINACESGNIQMAKYIMTTSTNKYPKFDWSFWFEWDLVIGCRSGNVEIVKLFVENGAWNYDSGMYEACKHNYIDIVKFLISRHECEDECYMECIYEAGCQGHLETVNLLIENGANDWTEGFNGGCAGGNIDIINLMIAKGANNWSEGMKYACEGGHVDVVKIMIAKGATNWSEGMKYACKGGKLETVKLMIEQGFKNWNGGLEYVREHVKYDSISIDIGHFGYSDDDTDDNFDGYRDIIKLMIMNGATNCGRILLRLCEVGCIGVIKRELVNFSQNFGKSLIYACSRGDIESVKIFIENGAIVCEEGLLVSCEKGNCDLVRLILEHRKFEPKILDNCLKIVCTKYGDNIDMIILLIGAGAGDLKCLKNIDDYRLYHKYCKHADIVPNIGKSLRLLKDYPPYIMFIGSKNIKKCSVSRLPVELFKLLTQYF